METQRAARRSARSIMRTCYYKILGVSPVAGQEEIKRAFRMLAKRFHPDRNPGDLGAAERFKEALKAYEILVDPARRCKYDRTNGAGHPKRGGRGVKQRRKSPVERSYEVILEGAFGILNERLNVRKSCDLRFDLQIHAEAAIAGIYEQIDYHRSVFCYECCGSGREIGTGVCCKCHGKGEIEEACSIRVWIPAGSLEGSRLRICGAGDRTSPDSSAGDLFILLYVMDGVCAQ